MKSNIKIWFKDLWHKEYRLTVINGSTYDHFRGETKQDVANLANYANPTWNKCTWSLYKSGRFFLPEREIERSNNEKY